MKLSLSRATAGTSSDQPDEQQLREARVRAARRSTTWREINQADLVPRLGGRVFVSAETDRVLQPYRGAVWQTSSASPVSDFTPLSYVVGEDSSIVFYEALPSSWTARLERKERRRARSA